MALRHFPVLCTMLVCILSLLTPWRALAQSQLIDGHIVIVGSENFCTDTGSTNAYACTLLETILFYSTGTFYAFKANTVNTGAATINLNSLGAKTIKKIPGGITTDLSTGDICVGQIVVVYYDGTNMQMVSQVCNASSGGVNAGASGGPVAYYPSAGTTVDDSTGFTLDATTILTKKDKVTAVSADTTLGVHNIVYCTAGATNKTMTLPAASSSTVGSYQVIKADTGAGACVLTPAGTDTLNGVAGSLFAWNKNDSLAATLVTSTNWQGDSSVAGPFAPNPQTTTYQVLPSDFSSYRTISVPSGTFPITLVASGAQPPPGQFIQVVNYGSGVVTIARSGQNINGGTASLVLPASSATAPSAAFIVSDGTNYIASLSGVASGATTQVRSIPIDAGSMDVSGNCFVNGPAALVTNGPKRTTIGCTDNDADSLEFDWVMPDGWDAGTITVELDAFSINNNNTEVLAMDFAGQCVRDGDAVAAHSTTGEQRATITWGNAANVEQHATTAALTLQGTCAAGAHVYMRGQIDATATTMTPMTDLKILGVKVEYTRTAND